MGKGLITGNGAGGNYLVKILHNTTQLDRAKQAIQQNIVALTALYNAEVVDLVKKNIYKLQIKSCEKQLEYYDNYVPEDEIKQAWCADLTEDLSGTVGTIEVPGEVGIIQIKPGFTDRAVYVQATDGQLAPTAAMSAAGAFYNIAMLPGWQKWKPTYRYATIDSISGDKADITLELAHSSQQDLYINQADTLTNVPIEYMTCNGGAFSEGDEVLVKFTGQNWIAPKIVGFKDNPQSCGFLRLAAVSVEKGGIGYTIVIDLFTAQLFKLYKSSEHIPANELIQPFISAEYSFSDIEKWNHVSRIAAIEVDGKRGKDPVYQQIFDKVEYEFVEYSPEYYGMEHDLRESHVTATFKVGDPLKVEEYYRIASDTYIDDFGSDLACDLTQATRTGWPVDFPLFCFREILTTMGLNRIYCTTKTHNEYHEIWQKVGTEWIFTIVSQSQSFSATYHHLDKTTTIEVFPISTDIVLGPPCNLSYPLTDRLQYAWLQGMYNMDKKCLCFYESMRVNIPASYYTHSVRFKHRLDALYVLAIHKEDYGTKTLNMNDIIKIPHDTLLDFFKMDDSDLIDDHYFAVDWLLGE